MVTGPGALVDICSVLLVELLAALSSLPWSMQATCSRGTATRQKQPGLLIQLPWRVILLEIVYEGEVNFDVLNCGDSGVC